MKEEDEAKDLLDDPRAVIAGDRDIPFPLLGQIRRRRSSAYLMRQHRQRRC